MTVDPTVYLRARATYHSGQVCKESKGTLRYRLAQQTCRIVDQYNIRSQRISPSSSLSSEAEIEGINILHEADATEGEILEKPSRSLQRQKPEHLDGKPIWLEAMQEPACLDASALRSSGHASNVAYRYKMNRHHQCNPHCGSRHLMQSFNDPL